MCPGLRRERKPRAVDRALPGFSGILLGRRGWVRNGAGVIDRQPERLDDVVGAGRVLQIRAGKFLVWLQRDGQRPLWLFVIVEEGGQRVEGLLRRLSLPGADAFQHQLRQRDRRGGVAALHLRDGRHELAEDRAVLEGQLGGAQQRVVHSAVFLVGVRVYAVDDQRQFEAAEPL